MEALGVGVLRALQRGCGAWLLGLLFRGAAFGAGAVFAAGAGVAGVVVCANAELMSSSDATAVAAAREEKVIMTVPRVEEGRTVAA